MLSLNEIHSLLAEKFTTLHYLESEQATTGRYKEKQIIIFEYQNIAGSFSVLKYFSLQHLEDSAREQEKELLLDEFHTARKFGTNPHVVRVYDADTLTHNGSLIGFYITMEKFDHILSDLIHDGVTFSEEEITHFLGQMDQVLYQAHYQLSEPIVHSDIKPANIGVRKNVDGEYEFALMDFDVSVSLEKNETDSSLFTLSNKASIKGLTLAYAPPEQAMAYLHRTGNISNRVDIYAIGAIAMQMLTGVPPQKDESQVYYQLPFDKVPLHWQQIFKNLCAPDPKQRVRRIAEAFPVTVDDSKEKHTIRTDRTRLIRPTEESFLQGRSILDKLQERFSSLNRGVLITAAVLLMIVILFTTFMLTSSPDHPVVQFVNRTVPVQVITSPAGVEVVINGIFVGVTDEQGTLLVYQTPGNIEISLSKEGYQQITEQADISASEPAELAFELISSFGQLLVASPVDNATIYLRDSEGLVVTSWSGDQEPREVLAGRYQLSVQARGFQPWSRDVEISMGDITEIEAQLIPFNCGDDVFDIDGNRYSTVALANNRCWFASNLQTSRYSNGDSVTQGEASELWSQIDSGAWVYVNNSESESSSYGKLYNWFSVSDSRGLCPEGWRLPYSTEWEEMVRFLGVDAGGKLKVSGTQHWMAPNTGATDMFGFSALPAGSRNEEGQFGQQGTFAFWWSSSEMNEEQADTWYVSYFNTTVTNRPANKNVGISVRCIEH